MTYTYRSIGKKRIIIVNTIINKKKQMEYQKQDVTQVLTAQLSSSAYFENEEGLVEEFAFDYMKLNTYHAQVLKNTAMCMAFCPCMCPWNLCFVPYTYKCGVQNKIDLNNAQHVCVTRDGIRYSVDKHKSGCRYDFQDVGRTMKTVPFDKITDCDVKEPAGASGPICCLVQNVVPVVHVDTASSGTIATDKGVMTTHELELHGLVDPYAFKKLVWKMKREGHGTVHASSSSGMRSGPPSVASMSRNGGTFKNDPNIVPMLKRQNEILEEHTKLLQTIANRSK